MPCEYQIDLENSVVRCRAWGVFTHPEATATREQFTSDPTFRADFSQVYDFTDVERIDMTADQIRALGGYSPFAPRAKRAAVAPKTAIFGALRMFALQHGAGGGHTNIQVFRSLNEAEVWLGLTAGSLR